MPTLEITTMVGCPLRCTFCPQDKLLNANGNNVRVMTLPNFKVMLSKVPRHVRIDFSGMAEPWANRAATDMLEHTLITGYNVAIYTTLQGMHDPLRVVDMLRRHYDQVEIVVIHLPDSLGNMRGFKGLTKEYCEALALFETISDCAGLRAVEFMMMEPTSADQEATPHTLVWNALTRAGNLDLQVIADQPIEQAPQHDTPLMCGMTPFYDHNVLLPNGDVVLCCMDYSLQHKLGNLLVNDYQSLFVSGDLNMLRARNMQYGYDDKSLCRKCSRAKCLDVDQNNKQFWDRVP